MKIVFSCFLILTAICFVQVTSARVNNDSNKAIKVHDTSVTQTNFKFKRRYPIPFAIPRANSDNTTDGGGAEECGSAVDDFPTTFTKEQFQHGAVVLCVLVGIYCFTLLAIICDGYFLPTVERICDVLDLPPDVAAATFMASATTAPELFTNIIATFITESDVGIGTVVGSSLFNSLGVASIGGIAAAQPIQLHWWPITRDIGIYIVSVSLLVVITWDGEIYWYEGLILFIVYFCYFFVMFQNRRLSNFVKKFVKKFKKANHISDIEKDAPEPTVAVISTYDENLYAEKTSSCEKVPEPEEEDDDDRGLFTMPQGSRLKKAYFIYSWPLRVLTYPIPNVKRHPKLWPLVFALCIIFIGGNSYMVSWMIAIIGDIFNIPDTVAGLTFLAAGGCLPESISITIIVRRGLGSFGVSNSLGANTMNILLSLGMPWFFKTITMGANQNSRIIIQSGSIEYTISALILVAIIMYLTFFFNKFRLGKRTSSILISVYLVFIVLAILAETIFFPSNGCSSN